jgi:hypothetical protein
LVLELQQLGQLVDPPFSSYVIVEFAMCANSRRAKKSHCLVAPATMTEPPTIDPILKQVICLYPFAPPLIKDPVDFKACFHSSVGTEQSYHFITLLTESRDKFRLALCNYSPLNQTLQLLDEYLPLLWQLLDSLDRQPPVRLDSGLRFTWKGSISILPEYFSYNQVIFELILALHSKGTLLSNLAREMVNSDPGSVNSAAKFLREASSVMNFLSINLIPRWNVVLESSLKPPECSSEYAKFLSDYFLACSHQLVVGKALQGPPPSSKLMTALCLNVVRSLEFSIDFLTRHCVSEIGRTDSRLAIHIAIQREFFYSLVYSYQADEFYSKTETGIAIALAAVAMVGLSLPLGPLTRSLLSDKTQ